ncbi:non-specific lipid transfer protein GPI-anchored 6 isoform X2 [Trifolium pratense]|uniref:Uncharacterized protein n=1 Tax=Trifolium pratense TaxID=57577 RepID=A0ACB0MDB4_TRIPR|nr:non-specific lipid transfer protein GPI-anchored 6 isoform X2 [Trifolium pratense]CAJ2677447.1 unnamed protein product [Trifolium pratense]
MGCKIATIFSTLIFLVLMFGLVTSDINQDKEECTQKLIALANCLPFVSGEAKTPPIDCCTGVKEVVDKSKRCLCILVKDHDDPSLGFTINVTLALQLPNDCKAPTNLTQCIDILHLAPKSKAAKIFEDFQKTMEKNSTTTPITPVSNATGKGTNSTGEDKSGGGSLGKRWLVAEILCGILPFVLVSYIFIV